MFTCFPPFFHNFLLKFRLGCMLTPLPPCLSALYSFFLRLSCPFQRTRRPCGTSGQKFVNLTNAPPLRFASDPRYVSSKIFTWRSPRALAYFVFQRMSLTIAAHSFLVRIPETFSKITPHHNNVEPYHLFILIIDPPIFFEYSFCSGFGVSLASISRTCWFRVA